MATINGTSGSDELTGTSGDDTIRGFEGDDIIDGGFGADWMAGGIGADIYLVDNQGDQVVEVGSDGSADTVFASVSFVLGSYVENLTLTGTAVNGTGNDLANILIGNTLANTLRGGAGKDTLNGGAGADTLYGGSGNDAYVVDNSGDQAVEVSASGGFDTVQSSVSFILGDHLENLTLTGFAALSGTGNALANKLIGNGAANVLDGGAGADVMYGGGGNDIYHLDDARDQAIETSASGGTDTVQTALAHTLRTNIENLVLVGTSDVNGFGNELANRLTGNSAANILDGGAGADVMLGNDGDDVYVVGTVGDQAIESSATGGIDRVESSVSFGLGSFVEELRLTGGAAVDGTGNGLDNKLMGNDAANVLNGGRGADMMYGGGGRDTYIVDDEMDVAIEGSAEGGTDTVRSTVSYTLGAHIENLTLVGFSNIDGTGNELINKLIGNDASNTLDGGSGADVMYGGHGDDTYIVDDAGDLALELSETGGIDTIKSGVSYVLRTNLENLTLTGTAAINATGNALSNTLTGNRAANVLDGGEGADTMRGYAGNDTYKVDHAGDQVIETDETGGTDTVESSITFVLGSYLENLTLSGPGAIDGTGNNLANKLIGNNDGNVLDGRAGADVMYGGGGNDTYVIDNVGDRAIETSEAGGIDTVRSAVTYTLGSHMENLTLFGTSAANGTGNALDNKIIGNSANNILAGGGGVDTLYGGEGDDTYILEDFGDKAIDSGSSSNDVVKSSLTQTLGANIERLILTGTAAVDGKGNNLDNRITGNGAANTLDGAEGADILYGGGGNDIYIVDNDQDVVVEETSAGGTDIVRSSVSYTLSAHVEDLVLTHTQAIDGTGNWLANRITGNSQSNTLKGEGGNDTLKAGDGNDELYGGLGNDTLSGGGGSDDFYFDTSPHGNVDKITDFSSLYDTIYLDRGVFTRIGEDGALSEDAFVFGKVAKDADDRILYDRTTGNIYYDGDGYNGAAAILFATVNPGTSLTAADFVAYLG